MKGLRIGLLSIAVIAALVCVATAKVSSSFIQEAKLAGPLQGSPMGPILAMYGDTVVAGASGGQVGAHRHTGLVYVYVKPASGWAGVLRPTATLEASDGRSGDQFGLSVAVHGDTIVVGAPKHRTGPGLVSGAAYVFVRPAAGWSGTLTETAELTSKHAISGFGWAVGVWGSTVVVGSRDPAGNGGAFVFVRPASGWGGSHTQTATLAASSSTRGDEFGLSVAIHGDTVAVGAPGHNAEDGIAYVFTAPASGWSGTVTETTKLYGTGSGELFGWSVAASSGRIVVGAPYHGTGKTMDEGAAYEFVRHLSRWPSGPSLHLVADHAAAFDELGFSVGSWAPVAVASTRRSGFAYVYGRHLCPAPPSLGPGGGGQRCTSTLPSIGTPLLHPIQDLTGSSHGLVGWVAIWGNTIVADARSHRIYVYVLPPPKIVITAPAGSYKLGTTVKASYRCHALAPARIATCSGPVPTGAAVDTSTPGLHTFDVTATDDLGGVSQGSVTYLVTST